MSFQFIISGGCTARLKVRPPAIRECSAPVRRSAIRNLLRLSKCQSQSPFWMSNVNADCLSPESACEAHMLWLPHPISSSRLKLISVGSWNPFSPALSPFILALGPEILLLVIDEAVAFRAPVVIHVVLVIKVVSTVT